MSSKEYLLNNPKESFLKSDEVTEDLLWNALEDFDFRFEVDGERFSSELESLVAESLENLALRLSHYQEVNRVIEQIKRVAKDKVTDDLNQTEKELALQPDDVDKNVLEEYNYSALETIVNLAWHQKLIDRSLAEGKVFMPKQVSWATGSA